MQQLVAIALGGACGALCRFWVSSAIYAWAGQDFPYGTLTVNVLGSFLIGILAFLFISTKFDVSLAVRSAILIGFLGSFTTFSTFSLETLHILLAGDIAKALLNMLLSVFCCLLATTTGMYLANLLVK